MGIRHLNGFFRDNCKNSITQIHLRNLRNKKIVIDISIYLYKFMSDGALLENIYLMISIFRHYNIKPLFVFDGPPPKEKLPLLSLRKEAKKNAERTISELNKEMNEEEDYKTQQELREQIDELKKKCVKIHSRDINNVKALMESYGVQYIVAPGEADELCAQLVINDEAYACISEDMDMFVYGCPRVLRYFSILKKTCIMYNFKQILQELQITATEFRHICICSGTDYSEEHVPLYKILSKFKKYRKKNNDSSVDFIIWMHENTDCYEKTMVDDMRNIEHMFNNVKNLSKNELKYQFNTSHINKKSLQDIMIQEGFIFPHDCPAHQCS